MRRIEIISKIQKKCQMIANNIEHFKKNRIEATEILSICQWITELNALKASLLEKP